ncbi:MAG: molybdenum cofactor guanylyltransferase [Canidatus Methanoxibalbensis ujae]|nr:molybdenum cofactor guanylyltransferase [Candidatus Methanoxibalbensis ujae]MCW7078016.1 molybdenum cofactor guanylyltransferase [Candidatus Methanoxibalbensis ujae]
MLSAVILAGGNGQRFFPVEKCIAIFRKKPLVRHVVHRISPIASEIIIVARDQEQGNAIYHAAADAATSNATSSKYATSNATSSTGSEKKLFITYDIIRDFGPLAGILSGLRSASHEFVFVTGCDMPFLNAKVVAFLFEEANGFDAVVPAWENGMIEPLHAIYRRDAMIEAAENTIKKGERRISSAIAYLRNTKFVDVAEIRKIDAELCTFININTPNDLLI